MLVLTRNVYGHNTLIIQTSDGDIEVSIRDVKGGKVQVGIEAPDSVDVWRSEVFDKAEAAA